MLRKSFIVILLIGLFIVNPLQLRAQDVHIEKVILEPETESAISCFDVNEQYIAIGFTSDRIDFYDVGSHNYLFSYTFYIGGGYSFRFDTDKILLFNTRGSEIYVFRDENYLNSLSDDIDLIDLHTENLTRNKIIRDGVVYNLERNSGISEIRANNNTIIRTEDNMQSRFLELTGTVFKIFVLVTVCSLLIGISLVIYFRKHKKYHKK